MKRTCSPSSETTSPSSARSRPSSISIRSRQRSRRELPPARLVVVDAVLQVEALETEQPLRLRLEVRDDRARLVDDAVAGLADAEAEVEILVPVPEPLVEAAELLGEVPPDQQTGAGHHLQVALPVDMRGAGRMAEVVVERPRLAAVLAHRDAGVLDRPVGIEQAAARDPDRGVGHRLDERLEPAGLGDRVVVQEQDELAAGEARALVAGAAEPGVLGVQHAAEPTAACSARRYVSVRSVEALSTTTTSLYPGRAVSWIAARHCLVSSRRS